MKNLLFALVFASGAAYGQNRFVGLAADGDSLFSKCYCLDSIQFPSPDTTWKNPDPSEVKNWKAPKVVPLEATKRIIIPLPYRKD